MRCYITNKTTDKSFKEYYPDIRLYFKETLKTLGLGKNYQIALILVDSRRIQEINRDYRGIDKETDVITFALNDSEDDYEMMEEDVYLGDIFINVDRVYSQAKEYEHSVKREFCFLFVHGLLHSLGYDHMNKKDEKVMFDLQKQILKDLR
ncbi:MAG: rRNA maturation RNase YbeY [Erysipelotrichaceae bacterium]|nr:rRNA maturation RNase YbeY [Erysipelotrichaceae bacterium]